ncbi:MAG: hypothetical protein ACJ74Y_10710 [Bryobacteraceae bacterium]
MSEHDWKWVCEFCFRTIKDDVLPNNWEWIYQSAVCPDCKARVEASGGYRVVMGGAYAGSRKDPRAK